MNLKKTFQISKTNRLLQFTGIFFSLTIFSVNADSTNSLTPTPEKLASIQKLLREVPLIDGHNDLPWQYRKYYSNNLELVDLRRDTSHNDPMLVTDFPRLRAGGVGGQFWSVYIPPTLTNSDGVQAVIEQIDVVHQLVKKYPDQLELALTADDVERIFHKGKIASLIGMEGGHSIHNSLAALRMTYALGARYMTLTHTKTIDWADAATDAAKHHGLTQFGEEVVHEMNRLGMLIDLSHVSDETMIAALKISKAPIMFSHSCARALCDHKRNVPDDILKMVASNGGIVMVNFYPEYVTEGIRRGYSEFNKEEDRLEKLFPNDSAKVKAGLQEWRKTHPRHQKKATLFDVADHFDHIRKVAGIDCVGIGSDYEGFDGTPEGLEDVSCYPALLAELSRRGYSDNDLKKIAGENILRVLRGAEKTAAQWQSSSR